MRLFTIRAPFKIFARLVESYPWLIESVQVPLLCVLSPHNVEIKYMKRVLCPVCNKQLANSWGKTQLNKPFAFWGVYIGLNHKLCEKIQITLLVSTKCAFAITRHIAEFVAWDFPLLMLLIVRNSCLVCRSCEWAVVSALFMCSYTFILLVWTGKCACRVFVVYKGYVEMVWKFIIPI